MKKIDELNKYIVSIFLTFCTPALIWTCFTLQEVKTKVIILETIVKPSIDMTMENRKYIMKQREDIVRLKTIIEPKKKTVTKKNLESSLIFTDPITFIDTEGISVDSLTGLSIINPNYEEML